MDIGVKKAGFQVLAEIEIDKHCCETLRAAKNREKSDTLIVESDIKTIDPKVLGHQLGIKPGKLDLLFGGPPCQSFSLAGKQLALNDDRGLLLFEIVRFAEHFKPKAILLEQVKGLLSAKGPNGIKGEVFDLFLSELERINYIPKWQVCCAADYGVPQSRERVFIVATYGKNGYSFPMRTHAPIHECPNFLGLEPYVTVGKAIDGLAAPDVKQRRGEVIFDRADSHVDVTPERDRERIEHVPEGSYLAAQTHLGKGLVGNLQQKDTTKYLRLNRAKPSNTLRCGEIFYHPTENRYLTPREYMRIHGYDDDYELRGPIRSRTGSVKNLDQHRQVANSVPPPLAYMISKKIGEYIHEQNI
jgi:DNA (cytosine-5)-methyltransferase 1